MDAVSLARALSKLGWCSRAEGERLVRAGRVAVDGRVVTDPAQRVDIRRARITVDGAAVRAGARVYLMMHKPAGYVTTTADERGRATVFDLLPADVPRVNAVGRLDLESEGLLLFKNDTRWADRLLDPASHVDKVYHVQLARAPSASELERALAGVDTGRGGVSGFRAARPLPRRDDWIEVVIDEGKNRQVRRVIEAIGNQVVRLIRTAIGPLTLGGLESGAVRPLTAAEKESLDVR
jgi:23S rRNA pseudouridine2605 synthase